MPLNIDFAPPPSAVVTLSSAPGITTPLPGLVRVAVAKGAIPAGRFEHELEITYPGGASHTPIEGELIARPAIFDT